MYVMLLYGMRGELTKLRAYGFQFWFQIYTRVLLNASMPVRLSQVGLDKELSYLQVSLEVHLLPGQSAQDRPDLFARVFQAKLEDLKVQLLQRHIIGVVGSHVYVTKFQKRGLLHAYFLLIMTNGYKMNNPEDYEKLVCTEIPYPIRFPEMHDLVKSHLMHCPYGSLREKSPCTQGVPKICRFRYPRQFNENTSQGED
uniref:Helitron helicase-like domain-containing protein n=1 Tax=Lactuca sativa TaxID=4236 RepID=A0A9R1W5N0_LACSA|nr:hypothetical protein LSAT_V11C300146780 [Lactuca sativa]